MPRQIIEPSVFSNVEINVEGSFPCTPPRPNDPRWIGIAINAPTSVTTFDDAPAVVPVCAFASLPVIVHDPPPMVLIAINRDTGEKYSGPAFTPSQPLDDGVPDPFPAPPLTQDQVSGLIVRTSFTTELVSAVNLPPRSAVYDIYIECGDVTSGQATIQIDAP